MEDQEMAAKRRLPQEPIIEPRKWTSLIKKKGDVRAERALHE